MIRVIVFALVCGGLAGLAWKPLALPVFVLVMAVTAIAVLSGGTALSCPACKKRIKIGATACSHCGRSVVRSG